MTKFSKEQSQGDDVICSDVTIAGSMCTKNAICKRQCETQDIARMLLPE